MTLASTISKITYKADGNARVWPFPFKLLDPAELQLVRTDGRGLLFPVNAADYAVSGVGQAAGGEVTYPISPPAMPAGERLTLLRVVNRVQDLDLQNQGGFFPDVIETQLDRIVMMIQEVEEKADRAVKVSVSSGTSPDELLGELDEKAADVLAAEAAASASAAAAAADRSGAENARAGAEAALAAMNPENYAAALHQHEGVYEHADPDILKSDEGKTLVAGFAQTPYQLGEVSGTLAPDVLLGAMQEGTVVGNLAINAPARDGIMELRLANTATAYTLQLSGYTKIAGEYAAGGSKVHLFRLTRYGAAKCIAEIAEEAAA